MSSQAPVKCVPQKFVQEALPERQAVNSLSETTGLDAQSAAMQSRDTQVQNAHCLLYTSPSPRDRQKSRMPSSA